MSFSSWLKSTVSELAPYASAKGYNSVSDLMNDYKAVDDFLADKPMLALGKNILYSVTGRKNRENEFYGQKMALESAKIAHQYDVENMKMQQDYESAMANTSYQRAVSDMQAAGLNPMLAYQQGGAAVPSVSVPSSHVGHGSVDTTDYLRDMLQFAVQTASVVASLATGLSRVGAMTGRNAVLAANNTASNSAKLAAATIAANSKDAAEAFRYGHGHVSYRQPDKGRSSFDSDDFFRAAVEKSYGKKKIGESLEDYVPAYHIAGSRKKRR